MIRSQRDAKQHAKARQRRSLQAQERLERDRRQAQQAAEALEQALHDLGLPENVVAEIEGRLRSQQKLLGKIVGVMFPPLFGPTEGKLRCDPVGPHRTGKVRMATSYSSATSDKASARYTARLCSVTCPLSSCSLGLMMPCFVRYVMN